MIGQVRAFNTAVLVSEKIHCHGQVRSPPARNDSLRIVPHLWIEMAVSDVHFDYKTLDEDYK